MAMNGCFGTRQARLLAGALLIPAAAPVWAQVEEITVSARRVDESLQTVPVSVSAFTEETIETARITNLNDLTRQVPNITWEAGESGRRGAPTLRGIGLIDTRGFDNAVGVFIDGVFISGRGSQNVRLLDLERVEVIRGPQSALYGRNTFAGAINYVSRRPDDVLASTVEATAAQDGMYEVFGSLSGPLGGDFSGRVAAAWSDDEGMFDNAGPVANTSGGIGGGDNTSVAGSLRYQPSDNLDVLFSAFYSEERLDNRPLFVQPNNCGELSDVLTFQNPTNLPSYDRGVPAYYCGTITKAAPSTLSLSPDAYSIDGDTTRLALDVKYSVGSATLQSITSWTSNTNLSKLDLDRTQTGEPYYGFVDTAAYTVPTIFNPNQANAGIGNFNTYFGTNSTDQTYWSQELRLTSDQEQRLRWTAGLFYFDQENSDNTLLALDASPATEKLGLPIDDITFMLVSQLGGPNWLGIKNPILPQIAFKEGSDLETVILADTTATQYSAFGSMEFDFTDRLTGSAELRYTYEERTLENVFDTFFGTPPGSFDDDWSFWDPRFILRYQATDDLMTYGSIAHGSRSGGQNVAVNDSALVPYDEETNWTYELGAKTTWFDQRLQFNAAVFYIDWNDAQFRERIPGGAGFITLTRNATGVTSSGIELELTAAPTERLTVGATYGYANPEFDDGTIAVGDGRLCDMITDPNETDIPLIPVTCVPSGGTDFNIPNGTPALAPDIGGNQILRTSKTTMSAFVQAVAPVYGDTDALLRLDWSYRSEMTQDLEEIVFAPSRTLVSLRLGLQNPRYDVQFWVENLTDEDAIESAQLFASDLNSFKFVATGIGINPRRLGVTARYRFGGAER
jgi:iron complex outermembrane receptor protein